MKKEISINTEKTEITLSLSLTPRIMARDPRMTITTTMAKTMLENDNYKLDKCIISDKIDNHNANSKHSGLWKFALIAKKIKKVESENVISETVVVPMDNKKKSKSKKKKQ